MRPLRPAPFAPQGVREYLFRLSIDEIPRPLFHLFLSVLFLHQPPLFPFGTVYHVTRPGYRPHLLGLERSVRLLESHVAGALGSDHQAILGLGAPVTPLVCPRDVRVATPSAPSLPCDTIVPFRMAKP